MLQSMVVHRCRGAGLRAWLDWVGKAYWKRWTCSKTLIFSGCALMPWCEPALMAGLSLSTLLQMFATLQNVYLCIGRSSRSSMIDMFDSCKGLMIAQLYVLLWSNPLCCIYGVQWCMWAHCWIEQVIPTWTDSHDGFACAVNDSSETYNNLRKVQRST